MFSANELVTALSETELEIGDRKISLEVRRMDSGLHALRVFQV